eukprot:scaffold51383_cov67-Cyclotella_meneghiniana.AAC.3
MLENLKRQEAVLPTIDRAATLEILMELQTLYFGDDEAVIKYGDPDYWNALAKGQMTCSCITEDATIIENRTSLHRLNDNLLHMITSEGYHVLPPSRQRKSYSSSAFTNTLRALKDAGWPPQFLLMYDETWSLLRDTVTHIIGDNINLDGDNITIESDVNIWSLHKHKPPGSYIGGNFINPHRDMVFDACHDDEEKPTSLSVWIPLNQGGATEFNGCMRCIPIEHDDFFYSSHHPRHSTNSHFTDDDAQKLIVEQFGCGIWDPSLVHWGGSYEASNCDEEPRSSLAFTIRLGSKVADFSTAAHRIPATPTSQTAQYQETGPTACLVQDCHKGGLKRRIQCARGEGVSSTKCALWLKRAFKCKNNWVTVLLLTSLKVNRERLQPHHPYRIQEGENSYLVMERVGNI